MKLSIRVYEKEGCTGDRFTVVFHGRYKHLTERQNYYLGCNGAPFHPMGIGFSGFSDSQIDYPSYKHLGKKLSISNRQALPVDVKKFIEQSARDLLNEKYTADQAEFKKLIEDGNGQFPILKLK